MHRSTYSDIKDDDNSSLAHISLRTEFDNIIRYIYGPYISPDDSPDVKLEDMPLYEIYAENTTDSQGVLGGIPKNDETPVMDTVSDQDTPMPKVNDNYVNNSVMFPREDNYYRGNEIV